MTPEHLRNLRECCQDDDAFERMQQILRQVNADVPSLVNAITARVAAAGTDRPDAGPSHLSLARLGMAGTAAGADMTTDPVSNAGGAGYLASRPILAPDAAVNRQMLQVLDHSTHALISLDQAGRITYVNRQAIDLFWNSYRSEAPIQKAPTLLGQRLGQAFPALVDTVFEQEVHLALAQQTSLCFDEFYPVLNRWFEVRLLPSADGLSATFLDVTEHRLTALELLEMSTALGNSGEGIARVDLDGRYVALNRAYSEALGYAQVDMLGMSWQMGIEAADRSRLEASYQHMLATGKAELEVQVVRADGSHLDQEMVLVVARDFYDQPVGHHCFVRDVTVRKRAERSQQQQTERERVMAAIAQRIRQSLDLEDILHTTVSEVQRFLSADRVVIYQFEANGAGTVVAEALEAPWCSMAGTRLKSKWFRQRLTEYRQGKYIVVSDVQVLPVDDGLRQFWQYLQVRAGVSMPIVREEKLWGILVAHQCDRVRHWEPLEVDLLEQLATQVAIALQQSELYQRVRQLNADLEAQVQERTLELQQSLDFEAMLKRITDAVRDSLDEGQILQAAVQELTLGLGADACDAALHNADQGTSTICYEYIHANMSPASGTSVAMADMPEVYQQLLSGQDFQFCPAQYNLIRPTITRNHAILACPMMDDQGVIGDLWVFKATDHSFNPLEVRLVQQVANQCAIGLRQARLYQAAQAQVAALEQLNQFKDDFLSTVSHELRTPVSNMKMSIHMLRRIDAPDRQQTYLDILEAECTREIDLINDLLDLQRLEANAYDVAPEPIDLRESLLEWTKPFQQRTRDRRQIFSMEVPTELPTLSTDKAGLTRILAELLNNACKYTSPQGGIHLQVALEAPSANAPAVANTVVVRVSNEAEIPPAELDKIFDKFYRVPNGDRWKQGGTGLGLTLVQRLVAQLGGTLCVGSAEGWTHFVVTLSSML